MVTKTLRLSVLTLLAGASLLSPLAAQEGDGAPFGYQGEIGPAHWGELDEAYEACAVGLRQSPIDIPGDAPLSTVDLAFNYQPSAINVVNNGLTIQVNYDPGSTIIVDGKTYAVAQFHFHVPSEHTIDGVHAPIEMHVVHVADDGALAVVGFLFDFADEDNPFLARFWGDAPAAGETTTVPGEINVADAFDAAGGKYSYSGSLTTPPCSEGVSWFVMADHLTVSRDQVAQYVDLLGMNARPTQPLNERAIGG